MARYWFVTIWRLDTPIERVWDEIKHAERWPDWWKGVEEATKLQEGDANDVGSVWHYVWKGRLPYRLGFESVVTRVEEPHVLEGRAMGELAGIGRWQLSQREKDGKPVTTVRYDWRVRTTRAWMNLVVPIARPLFVWNHDVIMRQGGEALACLLGANLLYSKNREEK